MFNQTELTSAYLVFSPGQQDQFYRPFVPNLDNTMVNNLLHSVEQSRRIDTNSFLRTAGGILSLAAEPQGIVQVPHTLQQARYDFSLSFSTPSPRGEEIEVISGFTNYDGISNLGHIDPNLVFHINHRHVYRKTPRLSAAGNSDLTTLFHDQNVLASVNNPNEISMRPEDAVHYQAVELIRSGSAYLNDSSLTLGVGASKLASSSHNSPVNYLVDICKSYVTSITPNANEYDSRHDDYYSTAKGNVTNGTMGTSGFYLAMREQGYNSSQSFTYSQLMHIWPRPDEFWSVIRPTNASLMRIGNVDTQHWEGADPDTLVASSLTHILPGILSRFMLMKLDIMIDNLNFGNQPNCSIMNYAEMHEGFINEHALACLEQAINSEVGLGLLPQYAETYQIYCSIDLLSTSYFEISLNGNYRTPFHAPHFCSSYMSPMRGPNESSIREIAQGVENLSMDLHQILTSKVQPEIQIASSLERFNLAPEMNALRATTNQPGWRV